MFTKNKVYQIEQYISCLCTVSNIVQRQEMQCFAFALYLQIFAISFSFTFQCPNISGIIVVLLYAITGHSECSLIRPSLNAVFIKELCQPQRYYVIYLAAKIVIQTFPNAST